MDRIVLSDEYDDGITPPSVLRIMLIGKQEIGLSRLVPPPISPPDAPRHPLAMRSSFLFLSFKQSVTLEQRLWASLP